MDKFKKRKEFLDFCDATQHNKDVAGWETLSEFDRTISNKNFNAKAYKQNNRIVIAVAGSKGIPDYFNDVQIYGGFIPNQFRDLEKFYDQIKTKYPNAQIESVGYSLGGTLSNLLSHRTGIKSTALAPIGSLNIVKNNKKYFPYDDRNITTYGRKNDGLFKNVIKTQSGTIYTIPDVPKDMQSGMTPNHYLHNFNPADLMNVQPVNSKGKATGYAAPVEDTINQNNFKSHATFTPESLVGGGNQRINTSFTPESLVGGNSSRSYTTFTPEEIGRMSPQEFARNEKAIMQQLKNGQIKPSSAPNVDFKSFKNPENGKSTIFTREDIEKMSTKEFTKNEKAINAQMNSVGIPYKKEVPTGTTTYAKEKAKTAASYSSGSSENGRWVTINGNHVFLEKEGK